MTAKPAKVYTPREIDALGATLVRWLWISIGGSVLGLVVSGIELGLLNRVPGDQPLGLYGEIPGPETVTLITGLARLPILALIVVTGFLFLKWIYRASRNAHALAGPLRTSPPWAVGWFFVPVAFLWVPFTAFSETWRASHDPVGWRSTSVPPLLRWWWGFWLIENLTGQASFRLGMRADTVSALSAATWAEVLSYGFSIAGTLAAIVIVRRLTAAQTQRLREQTF